MMETVSTTNPLINEMPAGRGKKGSQPSRKRKNPLPIAERVDRISAKNDNGSKSLQVISGSNNTLNIGVDSPPCTTSCTQFVTPGQSVPGPSYMVPGPSYMVPGPSYMVPAPYASPYYSWYEPLPTPALSPHTLSPPPTAEEATGNSIHTVKNCWKHIQVYWMWKQVFQASIRLVCSTQRVENILNQQRCAIV